MKILRPRGMWPMAAQSKWQGQNINPNSSVQCQVLSSLSHTRKYSGKFRVYETQKSIPSPRVTWTCHRFCGFQMTEPKSVLLPFPPLRISPAFHSKECGGESCSFPYRACTLVEQPGLKCMEQTSEQTDSEMTSRLAGVEHKCLNPLGTRNEQGSSLPRKQNS